MQDPTLLPISLRLKADASSSSDKAVPRRTGSPAAPHLFAVHVQVLPIDLQLDDDDLVVPLLPDGRVPDVTHVQ